MNLRRTVIRYCWFEMLLELDLDKQITYVSNMMVAEWTDYPWRDFPLFLFLTFDPWPCRRGHWLCGQWDHYEWWGTDPADDDGEREDDHSGGGAGTGKGTSSTAKNNANELPLLTFVCTNFTHPDWFRPAPSFLQNTHAHTYIHSHAFKYMSTDPAS